ncbi:MAG: MBL fold metallo-hydrolase [Bacteroidetes bacterium]|nr:MBL fold metallo-hydrolase [Bacteroidota bacterium]
MRVTVWGCRGSLPSPGPEKNLFGGNTSCVQVMHNNTCIVLDGGSGIQRLGATLHQDIKEVHILLTHLHLDHTMGLGFFLPLYNPSVKIHIWGPAAIEESLLRRLRRYFSPPLFPVRLNELPLHPIIHEIDNSEFMIDDIKIQSGYICHPGPTLGYRLSFGNAKFAYMPDHEIGLGAANFPNEPDWTSGYEIARDVDLLFHDAQYRPSEYVDKVGWGHSSIDDTLAFAKMCKVKKLELFHHDPGHTDIQLQSILHEVMLNKQLDFEVSMCAEGNVYDIS